MTPQERQLVDELFDRLAKLETTPRDPDAERLIADGARQAPHAVYALVQTALVQDEALRRANARIEELEAQLSGGEEEPTQQAQAGFLDSMRDAVFGRPREAPGSVPRVRPQGTQWASEPPAPAEYPPQRLAPGAPPQPPLPAGFPLGGGGGGGGGGSFLGTAASAAAGVIGGSLLLGGIRSMFGQHAAAGERDSNMFATGVERDAPSGGGSASRGLTRDAGIEQVSHHGGDAANQQAEGHADATDDGDDEADGFFGDDDSDGPGGGDSYDV